MALVSARKTVTTPGTAVALATSSTAFSWLAITAETDNTGKVAVGDANADATATTQQGALLSAGDPPLILRARDGADDLKDIWIDASVAGDGVAFTYTPAP